jgi:hypothetical protein
MSTPKSFLDRVLKVGAASADLKFVGATFDRDCFSIGENARNPLF